MMDSLHRTPRETGSFQWEVPRRLEKLRKLHPRACNGATNQTCGRHSPLRPHSRRLLEARYLGAWHRLAQDSETPRNWRSGMGLKNRVSKWCSSQWMAGYVASFTQFTAPTKSREDHTHRTILTHRKFTDFFFLKNWIPQKKKETSIDDI